MKLSIYSTGLIICLLLSCAASKNNASQESIDALNQLVKEKHFRIESDWAYPRTTAAMQQVANSGLLGVGNSANAISLIGNHNHLTISGDSISSYLPYFGERQMHVGYGGVDAAIEFKGLMSNYKTAINKDSSYTITFEAVSKSENFNVTVKIHPGLKSYMTLSGAYRFTIEYSGTAALTKNNI